MKNLLQIYYRHCPNPAGNFRNYPQPSGPESATSSARSYFVSFKSNWRRESGTLNPSLNILPDPATLDWQPIVKVEHYRLRQDSGKSPVELREEGVPYRTGERPL